MDKNKFSAVCQYQFFISRQISFILLLVLFANLAVGIFVKYSFPVDEVNDIAGMIDLITIIFSLIIGAELFNNSFRFSLYNGVSRKTYCIATPITILCISFIWAIITTGFVILSRKYASNIILFDTIYQHGNFSLLLWLLGIITLLIMLSMTLAILIQVLSKKCKLIVIGILITLVPILMLANHYIAGLLENIVRIKLLFLGVTSNTANPYLSFGILMFTSVILLFVDWLMIKKIEIK